MSSSCSQSTEADVLRSLAMLLVGRILAGFAVGLLSMSIPIYQAEISHPRFRGLIVGIAQQMIGIGFIVSTWVRHPSRQTAPDHVLIPT